MYAVIETGGKQYMVKEGDLVRVEKLNTEKDKSFTFDRVLMIGDSETPKIGSPLVEGAKVTAKVTDNGKSTKVKVFKKKRRKGYRRTKGHRQAYTELKITKIAAV